MLQCALFRRELIGDARETFGDAIKIEVTPFACQWYRDGQPIAAAEGGDQPTLKADTPGSYTVAVQLAPGKFDRLVAPSVNVH